MRSGHLMRKALPQLPSQLSETKKSNVFNYVEVDIKNRLNDAGKISLQKQLSWKSWITKVRSWETTRSLSKDSARYWKPMTLGTPILGPFIFISVAFIVALELVARDAGLTSNLLGNNAVAFVDIEGARSNVIEFSFLYLPTIIAVFYSILWSWVDLDCKRLEPWFQLSRPEGASASDSILLRYSYEFLAFVPIIAFRRRHWSVFSAGTAMMVIFWIITPLQSAIFATSVVDRVQNATMHTVSTLIPIANQSTSLTAQLLNTAYAVAWLGQKLPSYTTREFAVLPVEPVNNSISETSSEIWSSAVNSYGMDISCKPADIIAPTASSGLISYTFSNGDNCSVSGIVLPNANSQNVSYVLLYMNYYVDSLTDYGLKNDRCPVQNSNLFLAIWARPSSINDTVIYKNITALFCKTAYYSQPLSIQVNASDHAIIGSGSALAERKPLPDNFFNSTNLEYMAGTGDSPKNSAEQPKDWPNNILIQQFPRLQNYSVTFPIMNMAGFAIATNRGTMDDLSNSTILERAFRSAHQMVFALAFNSLTVAKPSGDGPEEMFVGSREDKPQAIVMVRIFSVVVECALGLVILLSFILWYCSFNRRSLMASDPSAITDMMSLVRGNPEVLSEFKNSGTIGEDKLQSRLFNRRFKLQASSSGNARLISTTTQEVGNTALRSDEDHIDPDDHHLGRHSLTTVRPKELSLIVGSLMVGTIVAGLVILVFLFIWIRQQNGMVRPTDNTIVLAILENYVPTALATFLEPFWVVLNRLLCLLQPFDELRRGNAKSSATIEVKYSSLPPQMVVFRALKSRHYILAVVCLISVSTNALAVILSALLNEAHVAIQEATTVQYQLDTGFSGIPITIGAPGTASTSVSVEYVDHFYVSLANLVSNTSLPPFVDDKNFYNPFNLTTALSNSSESGTGISTSTTGYTVAADCKPLYPDTATKDRVEFSTHAGGSQINFSTNHLLPGGGRIDCYSAYQINRTGFPTFSTSPYGSGAAALEVMVSMYNAAGYAEKDQGFCEAMIVAGWVRLGPEVPSKTQVNISSTNGRSLDYRFMFCNPVVKTAQFNVTVDTAGHVLMSNQTGEVQLTASQEHTPSQRTLFAQQISGLMATSQRSFNWHNQSLTSDWVNSLIKASTNSTALIDAYKPLPAIDELIPVVEAIYQRVTAVVLGLNQQLFIPASTITTAPATLTVEEIRIFMSTPLFEASAVFLILHLLTAIMYYSYRPKRFLPRMPTTMASIIAYFASSHALEDFDDDQKNDRYGYGRFIGVDGKPHIGIERHERVVPLEGQNPDVRRRKWGWMRGKRDNKEPKIWI